MRTKTRDAARRKAAARRSTEKLPLKRRRASPAAPAAGTAEDPVRAYSSSEYDSSSEDEGFEPEPAPRSKRRAATDDELPRKKTKSEHGTDSVYDWPSLKDDVDISAEEARAVDAAERGDSPRNADGAKALPVRDVPAHVFALFARFMEMEREIEVMVEGFPGNVHTSQMRITSLEQLLLLQLINFLCYDPLVKAHPRDGKTLLSNICVVKVQGKGKKSFYWSCEKRNMLAAGDAAKATENVVVLDAFPVLLPTNEDGVSTKPASKFVEICGGAQNAKALLQLHVARIALMCHIWELAHGKPLAVASWGENARALVALLGGRVRVLGHHMHPHCALMIYQKNWNSLDFLKHIQGLDECLTAIAKELGMTLLRKDGKIWYWRRLWKNDEAAGDAFADHNWEGSILRYEGLAEACEAAHNHRKWWLHRKERTGPSKWWGVGFERPSWVAYTYIGGVKLRVATCEDEDGAGLAADFARVALGLAPKNFPAFWDSIKAWVKAGENGVVPAAAPVVFRGSVRVDGVLIGVSEAVSSLEAEIKAAIAEKSDVAEELIRDVIRGLKGKQADDLNDAGIHTVADLAGANVDDAALLEASGYNDARTARAKLWSWIGAAAKRFDVDIGALPKKPRKTSKPKAAKTSTKERPQAHQHVRDGVANCSIRWLSG